MKGLVILGLVLTMLFSITVTVLAGEGTDDSWGIGLGIPYGLRGVNFDHNLTPNLDLTFGLGLDPDGKVAYNLGTKFYLTPEEKNFRPRLSCYYGINTVATTEDMFGSVIDSTDYNGLSVGIGADVSWGSHRHGLDFDLIYIVSTEADIDQLQAEGYDTDGMNGIKLSIGYRQKF